MHILLMICAILSLLFGGYAALSVASDIQIGLAATGLIGGVILLGLAHITEKLNKLSK